MRASSRLIVWRMTLRPPVILPVTANDSVVNGGYWFAALLSVPKPH